MNVSVSSRFEENRQIHREAPVGAENSSYQNPDRPDGLSWRRFVLLLSPNVAENRFPPSHPPLLPSQRATATAR